MKLCLCLEWFGLCMSCPVLSCRIELFVDIIPGHHFSAPSHLQIVTLQHPPKCALTPTPTPANLHSTTLSLFASHSFLPFPSFHILRPNLRVRPASRIIALISSTCTNARSSHHTSTPITEVATAGRIGGRHTAKSGTQRRGADV